MACAYFGLGSNLGDCQGHLCYALAGIARLGASMGVSGVYETEPHGYADQPPFLNMVARIDTALTPRALLDWSRQAELERGRVRSFPNAPRTLDIDLLLYGRQVVREDDLVVPHPRLRERPFVLIPLLEVNPVLKDPETGRHFRDDLARLTVEDHRASIELGEGLEERLGVRRIMAGEALLDEKGT